MKIKTTPLTIGGIKIPNNILLAPMAGITDQSFRAICRYFGAGMAYSEMVSAQSIIYGNAGTKRLLENEDVKPFDICLSVNRPWAVQLFGHNPHAIAEAIKYMNSVTFDFVDINMGCPVPKIVKNGEGSALMNDPPLAGRIIEAAVKASARPVTIKIRKGFSPSRVNAVEMARVAEASGAAAVAVHGRTRDQFYSGEADWEIVAEVKNAVKIPVIGSGDIFSAEQAARRLNESGCDGIMIARGALGNPWIFSGASVALVAPAAPSLNERIRVAEAHLRMVAAHKGERIGVKEMRKHISWYVKGLHGAANARVKINAAETVEEVINIINTLIRT